MFPSQKISRNLNKNVSTKEMKAFNEFSKSLEYREAIKYLVNCSKDEFLKKLLFSKSFNKLWKVIGNNNNFHEKEKWILQWVEKSFSKKDKENKEKK